MLLDVEHRMSFSYDAFVREAWMELRVEPRSAAGQLMRSFYLAVGPPSTVERYLDWNGNVVHHFGIGDYHDRVEVVARSLVETRPAPLALDELALPPGGPEGALLDFVVLGGPVQRSEALVELEGAVSAPASAALGEQIRAIGALILERFEYRKGVTDAQSTTEHFLEEGAGVCQDFAHLALGLLRLRNVPARYVSGYLHVGEGEEPAESHAWVEVHTPSHGWVPFDPTHGIVPDERYVTVAYGRHYDDVPPNKGVFWGSAVETMETEVRTRPGSPMDVGALNQQFESIDVPVYREVPDHGVAAAAPEQESQGGLPPQQ